MKKRLFQTMLFCFCAHGLLAQSMLSGWVVDSASMMPLPGAHVVLTQLPDSIKKATVTDQKGFFFIITDQAGQFVLGISHIGFVQLLQPLTVVSGNLNLGKVALLPFETVLDEVQIEGQIPLATQKGDTTEYAAQAYKTTPDASAADLVQKMPGIVVENGAVKAQGEDVREVLVDGKPFFGQDPTLALRNLPADVIDKIQVFDRMSDQSQFTGFDDGQTIKTINIITRADRRNGQFGKVYAGAGTEGTYEAGGNVNIFKQEQRIAVIAQANNINQQNFSSEDLLGVVSSNNQRRGGGGGRGRSGGGRSGMAGAGTRGSASEEFLVGQQSGISATQAIGGNYNDNWGEQWEVSGSYFFNANRNTADQETSQEFFLPGDRSQYYDEDVQAESQNYNHRIHMRMDYTIDTFNSLLIVPRLSFQSNDGYEDVFGQTMQSDRLLSQTSNLNKSDYSGYNFSNRLLYRHRFHKAGRTISIGLNTASNDKNGQGSLRAENIFFNPSPPPTADSVDQRTYLDVNGLNAGINAIYTEPLSDASQLQLSYAVANNSGDSERLTYNANEQTGAHTVIDSLLSNTFRTQYTTHQVGGGYRLRAKSLMMMAGLNYEWALLENEQIFPDVRQQAFQYQNLLPMAMLMWRMSPQKNLRLFYRTNTREPGVEQLQNVIDNSNPLQLRAGNPNLDQQYQHTFVLRYSASNLQKSSTFFAMAGGGITNGFIANTSLIIPSDTVIFDYEVPAGVQFSSPINLDGHHTVRSFISYGFPLKSLKSNLNLNASASYARIPGRINNAVNFTHSSSVGLHAVLSSNISEYVDFTLSAAATWSNASYTAQQSLNNRSLNLVNRAKLDWIFGKGFVYRTELSHTLNNGLSEGFNQNFTLWNMGLGKKFLKDDLAEIFLSVFDLLNQNTAIQRVATDGYLEDVQTNVLTRYFMLTCTYRIRHFKVGQQ